MTPLSNAVLESKEVIKVAAKNGKDSVLDILDFIKSEPAVSLNADSIGTVVKKGADSYKDFARFKKASSLLDSDAKKSSKLNSIKSMLKKENLPTKGKIRFIPTKGSKEKRIIENINMGNKKNYGFKDKFGNIWVKGIKSKTPGYPYDFEWDVQLSKKGKSMFGWASKSGKHLNVSPDGKITH